MTAIVSAYVEAAGLWRHCIYCGLIVGETIQFKDGIEYERYVKTDAGPVCGTCYDDPLAKGRAGRATVRSERKATHGKQCRQRRDIEILRLADLGWSGQRIANKLGLSPSMIGKVVKRARA